MKKVAVIGAGIAGVVCAHYLNEYGFNVILFDKSRGVSGRSTTKRFFNVDNGIDMGVPYIYKREISEFMKPLINDLNQHKVLTKWEKIKKENAQIFKDDTFVGIPKMSRIARYFSSDLQLNSTQRVNKIKKVINKWLISTETDQFDSFDTIIFAIPSPQLIEIEGIPKDLTEKLTKNIQFKAINTFLIETSRPLWTGIENEAVFNDSIINKIIANYKKPQRDNSRYTYAIHANSKWSTETFEELSIKEIEKKIYAELKQQFNLDKKEVVETLLHRWKYAIPVKENTVLENHYFQSEIEPSIFACGDWCYKPTFASAMETGYLLAKSLK